MPCDDVTEYLQLTLDADERIAGFSLTKHTCGAAVGDSALLPQVSSLDPAELLKVRLSDVLDETEQLRAADAFLLEKQLVAIQAAMDVYLGHATGSKGSLFTLDRLASHDGRTEISGLLRVDLATEKIRACKNRCCSPIAADESDPDAPDRLPVLDADREQRLS
jgi:hypothetical protein